MGVIKIAGISGWTREPPADSWMRRKVEEEPESKSVGAQRDKWEVASQFQPRILTE